MGLFNWVKKQLNRTNVESSLNDSVTTLNGDDKILDTGISHVHTIHPPNPSIQPVANQIPRPFSPNIHVSPYQKDKRVSKYEAELYVAKIDVKIAALIRQSIGKVGPEKDSFDVSISTLEMTRDLVKQIFMDDV